MENAGVFGAGTVEHTLPWEPWEQLGSLGGGDDGPQDWSRRNRFRKSRSQLREKNTKREKPKINWHQF